MLTVTRNHSISAAHRLFDYNGTCERLHGHNYMLEITLGSSKLDKQGMVLDFAKIKSLLLSKLDALWDHRTLLYDQDPLCAQLLALLEDGSVCPVPFNPTAENMARYLGEELFPSLLAKAQADQLTDQLTVERITVYETENNSATWRRNDDASCQ